MAIRADRLFRLILKTDRNEITKERYKRILGVEVADDGRINSTKKGILRIISRGPFLAMFKHESQSFVHSLEQAARLIVHRKKKRIYKKAIINSDGESKISVNKTVKSAPGAPSGLASSKVLKRPSGLKRKKSDKTGMIIMTEENYSDDDISAVSVSPVNMEDDNTENQDNSTEIPKGIQASPSKPIKTTKVSFSDTKRKRSRVDSSRRSSKKSRRKSSSSSVKKSSRHIRNDSSMESVGNIRDIMQANVTPSRESKRQKMMNAPPIIPLQIFNSYPVNDYMHPIYTMNPLFNPYTMYTPYGNYPSIYPSGYGQLHSRPWTYQYEDPYAETKENQCSEESSACCVLGSISSFLKRLLGNNAKPLNADFNLDQMNYIAAEPHSQYRQNQTRLHHNPYSLPFVEYYQKGFTIPNYDMVDMKDSFGMEDNLTQNYYQQNRNQSIASLYNVNTTKVRSKSTSNVSSTYLNENKSKFGSKKVTSGSSKDKLDIYNFTPSFPLPEPERHQYESLEKKKISKPRIYDCSSDIDPFKEVKNSLKTKTIPIATDSQLLEKVSSVCEINKKVAKPFSEPNHREDNHKDGTQQDKADVYYNRKIETSESRKVHDVVSKEDMSFINKTSKKQQEIICERKLQKHLPNRSISEEKISKHSRGDDTLTWTRSRSQSCGSSSELSLSSYNSLTSQGKQNVRYHHYR